jgi:hypothetical protein
MTVVIGTRRDGSTAWLGDPAGRCWHALEADGLPDDGITDAGRTTAEQRRQRAAAEAGLLPATAAIPGTSKHENLPPDGARAVDARGDTQAWLIAHAPSCWSRPLLNARTGAEPWHWEHTAALCRNQNRTTNREDYDMRGLFEALYRLRSARQGTDAEVDFWTVQAAQAGWSQGQAVAAFDASPAEPGTVTAAYRATLDREPDANDLVTWPAGRSIGEVWAGVAVEKSRGAR